MTIILFLLFHNIQSIIPKVAAPIPNPSKMKAAVKCSNLSFS